MVKKRNSSANRKKIMQVAEKLFAEQGFDGARMDEIARQAGVNKALIYYYFKSKDDVLDALFLSAMDDIVGVFEQTYDDMKLEDDEVEKVFNLMFKLLEGRKSILKIMFMESLKTSDKKPALFKIGEYFISSEVETIIKMFEDRGLKVPAAQDKQQMMVTEFFTGMMPLISLIVFGDDWCRHFGLKREELKQKFFTAFKMTHFAYHQNMME